MSPAKSFFTCSVCNRDRFLSGRRLFFLPLADGTQQRNWATDSEDSHELVCDYCHTVYVWNSTLKAFEPLPPFVPPA